MPAQTPSPAPRIHKPAELHLQVGLSSDVGPARKLNEDYGKYYIPDDDAQRQAKGALFLVADGMGGHQAGEVASRKSVERIIQEYYTDTTLEPGDSLVRAIKIANQLVYDQALTDADKTGMGTTMVATVVLGRRVYVANVGDSRAYVLNRTGLSQITEDHSWVQEQVQAGMLTREQAQRHPQRNLITRALGSQRSVEVDLFRGEVKTGDTILLCTDGLSGALSEEQMVHLLRTQPPDQAAAQLVAQAGAQRGDDNATALVVQVAKPQTEQDRAKTVVSPTPTERPLGKIRQGIKELLDGPGLVRLGEKRQRIVAGVVAILFVLCLCATTVLLPALGQELVADPVSAPYMAPLRDSRLAGNSPAQIAQHLGYQDPNQMFVAHGGQANVGNPAEVDLWPAERNLFLVGKARKWQCQEQTCTFDLSMANQKYKISYQQAGDDNPGLGGRMVRVFGRLGESQDVTARLIERGSAWWAWWQPAWEVVHQQDPWDRAVWVYGTVDRNPNGLLDLEHTPSVEPGAQVLLHGLWKANSGAPVFDKDEQWSYYLEGDRYVPGPNEGSPLPKPTITLQPTGTTPPLQ